MNTKKKSKKCGDGCRGGEAPEPKKKRKKKKREKKKKLRLLMQAPPTDPRTMPAPEAVPCGLQQKKETNVLVTDDQSRLPGWRYLKMVRGKREIVGVMILSLAVLWSRDKKRELE